MHVAERLIGHLHPALAALGDAPSSEGAFWERMAAARTPLVEPDPGRPGHSLVTYVFPMPEGAAQVAIQPGFGRPLANVMDRIAGTNVCHASYRYRNDVRATYNFYPDMPLLDSEQATDAEMKAYLEAVRTITPLPDPYHREVFVSRATGRPDVAYSILSLPDAPAQPFVARRPDAPHGKLEQHMLTSAALGNERRIWVYTPPGYEAEGCAYPMLVAFDGGASLTLLC